MHLAGFSTHQSSFEDPHLVFHADDPQVTHPEVIVENNEAEGNYQIMEKRLKMFERLNIFGLDAIDMCFVPDVTLPPKFKVPYFEKYKGLSYPKGHLVMYCRKMASYSRNDKIMVHCFQDSLTEASLKWYINLDRGQIQALRD